MAFRGGICSGLKLLRSSEAAFFKTVSRGLHATAAKNMGGGHESEPFYLHAKHMYNLDRMKHQKVKMTLSVLAVFTIGAAVPVYAVIFQQNKSKSA